MSEERNGNENQSARIKRQIATGKISPITGVEDVDRQLNLLPKNIALPDPSKTVYRAQLMAKIRG
ncbi:MAG: hypothetical protein Q8P92_05415 [Candidatus Daviesbacteria bacterium]|nr:hypothetical protein [Candidatus Daviesbacteria bacterium]